MILKKQETRYKEYLKVQKEYNRLWILERSRPYTEVKPYQHGWIIVPDLRQDAKNRRDAPLLQKILDLTMNPFETMNVEFIKALRRERNFDKVYTAFFRHNYIYIKSSWPLIRDLSQKDWNEIGDPYTKSLFKAVQPNIFNTKMSDRERNKWVYMVDIPHYYIVPRIKKRIVTREKDVDARLMRDIAYTKAKMDELAMQVGTYMDYSKTYLVGSVRAMMRNRISHFKKGELEDISHPEKDTDHMYEYYW